MPVQTQYFELSDSEFEKNQQNEINEGIREGLSVEYYAKSCYDALQMREIRLGLLSGVDVEQYASDSYDFFQMQEIRLGLEDKIDVSKYAYNNIPYDKMRQLRLSLEEGFNLFKYRNYDAGIINQIRLAAINNVDIRPFIFEGYDAGQLAPIRLALMKNINIKDYICVELRGVAINEVFLGLEKCLDVKKYCDPEYDWRQMREIRIGLEYRVDVDEYINPLYDWRQMREIRLGLQQELDVSYYKSFMYTPTEMSIRRKRLIDMEPAFPNVTRLENSDVDCESPEISELVSRILGDTEIPVISGHDHHFSVNISEDGMQAFVNYSGDGSELTKDYIYSTLKGYGVSFGVINKTVEMLVEGRGFGQNLIIAKGKNPGFGRDGWYEFFFDLNGNSPRVLPDGSVNYREYEWFIYVQKDQKLVEYHPAECGNYGYTVNGKMLKGTRGKDLPSLSGKGFYLSEDKNIYYSAENGKLSYDQDRLEVTGVLELDEVTQSTGDIEFAGSVHVKGKVGNGVKIKAMGDVVVDGFVEGAIIDSGGNILIRSGANGGGYGFIMAKGSINGQFFERTQLIAGGEINADYILNCDVSTDNVLKINGSHGNIIGGKIRATLGVYAKNIGNWANVPTTIVVGLDESMRNKINALDAEKNGAESEIRILKNAQADFQKKYPPEIRNALQMYIKIENAIYTKELDLKRIENERTIFEDIKTATKNVVVDITGHIYENIEIHINGASWQSRVLTSIRLKNVDGKVVSR